MAAPAVLDYVSSSSRRSAPTKAPATWEDRQRWRAVQRGYSSVLASAMLAVLPADDPLVPGLTQTLSCRRLVAVNVTNGPLSSMTRAPGEVPAGEVAFSGCCRQRWCAFCWSVRASELRARLVPIVQGWGANNAWFVTLTEPNVAGDKLRETMRGMTKRLRACVLALRRAGVSVALVRRNEVTFNPETKDYHPHLHLLVRGQLAAQMLRSEWLNRTPRASSLAQDCQRADPRHLLRELTKYVAKPMATGRKEGTTQREYWPAYAVATIYRALSRLRLFAVLGVTETDLEAELEAELETAERGADRGAAPAEWLRDVAEVVVEDVTGLRFLEWDDAELCWRSGPVRLGGANGDSRARELVTRYAEALRGYQESLALSPGG